MPRTPSSAPAETPMRSLRERQRAERAALILSAASAVFAEKGYADAAIDEIAARAGIAKGTVYLHFASKDDLVAALAEGQIRAFVAWLDELVGAPLSVRERLERLLLYVYARIHEQHNQVLLELNHRMGLSAKVIETHADLQSRLAQVHGRLAALIDEGKRAGELADAVPTPVMLATLVALLSPGAYEHLLTSQQLAPAALAGMVSHILFPPHPNHEKEPSL
ncbi:MAG TPA: TetR/AcrR family transcriptional regulator [Herpetosiphonaceae bacterium]|nr:TetR/AcrR family transcriptional regulator [Herpetosiphonaceae bacterium]